MKKFIINGTTTVVKEGDILQKRSWNADQNLLFLKTFKLEGKALEDMVKNGYLIPIPTISHTEEEKSNTEVLPWYEYLDALAYNLEWKREKIKGFVEQVATINPNAAVSIVLRELALTLDMKYPDHIRKSKDIFIISPLDGNIHRLHKDQPRNYKSMAAFRTIEDATFAYEVCRPLLEKCFDGGSNE